METQFTKQEVFAALENTGFGSPEGGSWLFENWEEVAAVAKAYIRSYEPLDVFVCEEESVKWAAEMLAADLTEEEACGFAEVGIYDYSQIHFLRLFCHNQFDRIAAAQYLFQTGKEDCWGDDQNPSTNVEAFVRACREWVDRTVRFDLSPYEVDYDRMTRTDVAFRFLKNCYHRVSPEGMIEWNWKGPEESNLRLDFDLVLEIAEDIQREFDLNNWAAIMNSCYIDTALDWVSSGIAGPDTIEFMREGFYLPYEVREIKESGMCDFMDADEIGEWKTAIEAAGADEVAELFRISEQVRRLDQAMDLNKDIGGIRMEFDRQYVVDMLHSYLQSDCALFEHRQPELPTLGGSVHYWLERMEKMMEQYCEEAAEDIQKMLEAVQNADPNDCREGSEAQLAENLESMECHLKEALEAARRGDGDFWEWIDTARSAELRGGFFPAYTERYWRKYMEVTRSV